MFAKVSLVLVAFCLFLSIAEARELRSLQEASEMSRESQARQKKNYLRAQAIRLKQPIKENALTQETVKNSVSQFQRWLNTSWKKFKRNALNVNKSNQLPVADLRGHAQSSGPHSLYNFFLRDLEDPDGEIVSLEWDFDDGSTMHVPYTEIENDPRIQHIFPSEGEYEVTVKIYDNDGEFSVVTRTVNVEDNGIPAPNFGITSQSGNIVNFSAAANDPENSVAEYIWDFGDGSPEEFLNTNTITHEFPAPGSYNVRLEVIDTGDLRQTIEKTIYVDEPVSSTDAPYPIVKISTIYGEGPTTVEFDASLSVDANNSSVSRYEWDFGDYEAVMNYSTLANPVHRYKAPGSYGGRLRIWDSNDNEAEYYFTVYIHAANNAPRIIAHQWNNSREIEFNASAPAMGGTLDGDKFFWSFGDGKTSTDRWGRHTYALNGNYTVNLVAYDVKGIRHSVLHKITVTDQQDMPEVSTRWGEPHLSLNQSREFDASESTDPQNQPLTYFWNFSDGSHSTDAVAEHDYSQIGHYPVKLFVTNSRGLSNDRGIDVMVQDGSNTRSQLIYSPRIGTAPLTVNFDSTQSFSSGSTIVDKIWRFDGNEYITDATFSKTFNDPGRYFVRLYVIDALGNEAMMGRDVHVLDAGEVPSENIPPVPRLQVEYGGPNPGELGFKAWDSYDEDGWIPFYEWTLDGVPQVDDGELWKNLSVGNHTIVLTVRDEWNGSASITRNFRVNASKDTQLDMAMTPSSPNKLTEVEFDGTASEVNGVDLSRLRWDFGDGNTARGSIVHHVYAHAGTYTIKLSVTDLNGQRHSITDELIVSEP